MPLYEYRCKSCGDFEAWRRISELESPMHCPSCQLTSQRLFSAPNVNLNMGGLSQIGRSTTAEPRLVKQEKEPAKPKFQPSCTTRPWMIGHAAERL